MDFEKMRRESGMTQPHTAKLTPKQLAEVMYEGTVHVQNLAEKLARQHGNKVQALTFFSMMPDYIQNFWIGIATQLINHSKEWQPNVGSSCVLSDKETKRLKGFMDSNLELSLVTVLNEHRHEQIDTKQALLEIKQIFQLYAGI